jgi:hypothetical protein
MIGNISGSTAPAANIKPSKGNSQEKYLRCYLFIVGTSTGNRGHGLTAFVVQF